MSNAITETLVAVTEFLKERFPDCEVQRYYRPNYAIEKVDPHGKPRIVISLYDRDIAKPTRAEEYENFITIDVSIAKKTHKDSNQEIDPLVDLVGQVFEAFYQNENIKHDGYVYHVEAIDHGDYRQVCFEEFLGQGLFLGEMQLKIKTNRGRG